MTQNDNFMIDIETVLRFYSLVIKIPLNIKTSLLGTSNITLGASSRHSIDSKCAYIRIFIRNNN